VVSISDVIGAVKNISGLDIPKLVKHLSDNCGIKGFDEGNAVNPALLLIEECVVLIPPALGVVNK
jgi:glutamate dehydrogenase (NAD(P)+)